MDVGIDDGRVVQLGGPMDGTDEIDAAGHYVLPGGVDPHVHLTAATNHPGERNWVDDFESGSRAALAGGVTTVGNITFPYPGTTMATAIEPATTRSPAPPRSSTTSCTRCCETPTTTTWARSKG